MAFSAFEQFEIIRILPIHLFGNFDISFTNSTLFMLIAVGTFYFLFQTNIEKGYLVPGRWQSVIEIIYEAMHNVVKENIGTAGAHYFPFIFTLFIFIGMINIFGIVPYTFTPTAHIAVTFGMALSIFIGATLLGLINYRLDYFAMFMPQGSPLVFAPLLVVIEFASHTAKAISLGVRLAANITAGHLLFSILSGFVWTMLTAGGLLAVVSILPFFVVFFITVLEMGVAAIQAYVFVLLTSIYLNEGIHLH